MRSWIVFSSILIAAILLPGCGDDETNPRPPGEFNVSLNSFPVLPESLYYEAFVRFPDSTSAAHEGLDAVSLAAFTVDSEGNLHSLSGEPVTFTLAESRDLNFAADVVVNVRSALNDTSLGSPLLGGLVTGNPDEGRVTLTMDYHDAVGTNLSTAGGSCILHTPSTGVATDDNQGVWFVSIVLSDPPIITPSLQLPVLGEEGHGEDWVYAGWIARTGETLPLGTFLQTNVPDSDGAGPLGQAGPSPGFDAPGSDFVLPPPGRNLNDGETTVFITIEPAEFVGGSGGPEPLPGGPHPFPIHVLELAIPLGAAVDSSMTLIRPGLTLPSGSITFTR